MVFTSEQVSCGHPDKICDQISDAIVTDCLKNDRSSRCGVECLIKDRDILISGELSSLHHPDLERLAFDVLHRVGILDTSQYWVTDWLGIQSPDIAQGVDTGGAGDQGMMFGYATDETPEMLPIPFAVATLALRLLRSLDSSMFLPDAKAQVSFDYATGKITTFLISTQHRAEYQVSDFSTIVETIMETAAEEYDLNTDFRRLVNPTGRFVIGGSFADCGLTGRKIIADTYGGVCRHGGGALSGKDPTKVDRSGAYMARKIAKDIVRAGDAKRCEVQLAYAIGVAEPVSVGVDCFGTEQRPVGEIVKTIHASYDMTPRGIIDRLHLMDVDYNDVAAYGHFGRCGLPWEE